MKSRNRHHGAKRSRWAHVNTPEGLRRRRAAADARREAICATLPPAYEPPAPLSPWQTVLVLDAAGQLQHRIALYVPTTGRCDQHAAEVDGVRGPMMTATEVGAMVRGWIAKRPSVSVQAEIRRDDWLEAKRLHDSAAMAQSAKFDPRGRAA